MQAREWLADKLDALAWWIRPEYEPVSLDVAIELQRHRNAITQAMVFGSHDARP